MLPRIRRTALFVLVAAGSLACLMQGSTTTAFAANCNCYYSSDCPTPPEGQEKYCDYQAICTRHCELLTNWQPGWGAPPTSRADCDNYQGPCRDNLPQPPNGTDGNKVICEPPTAQTPTTPPETVKFKMRDGNCATRPKKVEPQQQELDEAEVRSATSRLISLAETGGGIAVLEVSEYMDSVMHNLAQFGLGPDDYITALGQSAVMNDVRGTCAARAIETLGRALLEEIRAGSRRHGSQFQGRHRDAHQGNELVPARAASALRELQAMPAACIAYVETRPHNCQFPHPPEHFHDFEFPNGIACIADQIGAMAASMGY